MLAVNSIMTKILIIRSERIKQLLAVPHFFFFEKLHHRYLIGF